MTKNTRLTVYHAAILPVKRKHKLQFMPDIIQLRDRLNTLDKQLVELLAERMLLSRKLAPLKQARGMQVLQPKVWEQQVAFRLQEAEKLDLDPNFIRAVFELIHQQSVATQLNELHKINETIN